MGTSPGVAADTFARAMQSKRVQRNRSNGLSCAFIGALSYLGEIDDFGVIGSVVIAKPRHIGLTISAIVHNLISFIVVRSALL
jgi:hypothetical protein